MKILLAVDESQPSQAAVSVFLERPWPPDTEVTVLSVAPITLGVHVPSPPIAGASLPYEPVPLVTDIQTQNVMLDAAESIAQRVCERLRARGIEARARAREGTPGQEIVDEARALGADLVIVGGRSHSGLMHVLLGSTSQYVTHHAPCSVEVARGAPAREA